MFDLSFFDFESFLLLIFTGLLFLGLHRLEARYNGYRPASIEDYLFKLARITQKSEYDIFHEAASQWPISNSMVEEDFKKYLLNQTIPYYVNDFIRKHKHYLDKWRMPSF